MVSLYIDGTPVVLPSDFATEIKVENSFFTKSGEYTYDFNIPLNNPTNAALYSHLHRVNSVSEITEKRQAVLIADNRCFINGTEIITDWTDDAVSIQLASGNSELNYLIGSNLQVSFLDMGKIEIDDDSSLLSPYRQSLFNHYPNYDYVAAPVMTATGLVVNEWQMHFQQDGSCMLQLERYSRSVPQPYLCALVRKMLIALGYTIGTNQLENSRYSQLIVTHDVNTWEYAKMLPGWSVKDFFENLENLFNLVLVVNNKKRTVDIVFANQFYLSANEVHLNAVEDEYEVAIDEEQLALMTNADVNYDVPDSTYFRFAKLDENIINICDKVEESSLTLLSEWFQTHKDNQTIGTDKSTGRQYVYSSSAELNNDMNLFPLREVNQYASLIRGRGQEINLKFIPCAQSLYQIGSYSEYGELKNRYNWVLPSIEGEPREEIGASSRSVVEMIESGGASDKSSSGLVNLAFWHGIKGSNSLSGEIPTGYPLVMSDCCFQLVTEEQTSSPVWLADPEYTLRLSVLDTELYKGVYDIDTSKAYKFYTSDPNLPNAHFIFVIRNKRFVCREMSFQIVQGRKQKRWCLTCYPIEISDTESYKRWILSDGKWRDGGAWLDDGRWLDG